ncbi:hypothetical protein SAMN05216303_10652 [Rhodoferax sp. OV413]|uniref:cell division protein n=1 Tax=Rhodoferax sp. OV413 TaxID=1855285 RepID=UPI00088E6F76|nr:cell division protein [Rhodoferax sp. OV413]SDP67320.1 hypothetical protein SAMN05216303_10652 [Rhodoferax sp. OV413]
MPKTSISTTRTWVVRWMYAAALVHFLVGALLPWVANFALFNSYHQGIETAFWSGLAPVPARAQQVWWLALFGATVQCLSLWMWALIRIGDTQKNSSAWGWLIAGLVIWAPQDMLISLQAQVWPHVWADGFALASMLPPLVWLYRHDRTTEKTKHA